MAIRFLHQVNLHRQWREYGEKGSLYTESAFRDKVYAGSVYPDGRLLLLLAFMLYRFGLSEKVVSLCIIGIYIAVTFLTGVLSGRRAGRKSICGAWLWASPTT